MIDHQMHNILSKLDNVDKKKKTLTESTDLTLDTALKTTNQDSMRGFLSIINEDVSPEGPKKTAMPGTHTMAKGSKDGQHPAHEYLVGGEEGDVPDEADEQLDEQSGPLTPDDDWWGGEEGPDDKEPDDEDQSQAGYERELDEGAQQLDEEEFQNYRYHSQDDNSTKQMKQDQLINYLVDKKGMNIKAAMQQSKQILSQGLGESEGDDSGWGDEMIEDLRLLISNASGYDSHEIVREIEMIIQQYEVPAEEGQDFDSDMSSGYPGDMDESIYESEDTDDDDKDEDPFGEKSEKDDDGHQVDESTNVYEQYDPQSMTFKMINESDITEDDIEEDTIADKSTARKTGLQNEKGSFKDVFKSIEEKQDNLGQELYSELSNDLEADEDTGKSRLNDDMGGSFDDEAALKEKIHHVMSLLQGGIGKDVRPDVIAKLKSLKQQLKALTQKDGPKKDPRRPYSSDHDMTGRTHSLYDSIEKKHKGLK